MQLGEFMDEVFPELPPLFGSLTDEREEENDKAIAPLLEEEGEEDDDDAILPPNPSQSSRSLSEGSLSPVQAELDLLEMCRRAAAKHSIDWLAWQAWERREISMTVRDFRHMPLPLNSSFQRSPQAFYKN